MIKLKSYANEIEDFYEEVSCGWDAFRRACNRQQTAARREENALRRYQLAK